MGRKSYLDLSLLILFVAVASLHGQHGYVGGSPLTPALIGSGSSSLYLELGQVAEANTPNGLGYTCLWTAKGSSSLNTVYLYATDPTTSVTENGQSWVAWQPDSNGDCNATTTVNVDAYLQTDSVVGDRCLFNGCTLSQSNTSGAATASLIYSGACTAVSATAVAGTEVCNLPSNVSGIFSSLPVNTAGTDIRPEDAVFATLRVGGTGCGAAVAGSQYLGLGYGFETSPSPLVQFLSYFGGSPFNVTNFTLPSSYSVFRLGASPVIVHVNQMDGTALGAGHAGFADTNITNITSGELANFLDGTYSRTGDLGQASGASEGVVVLIREALSGTYNTMEYNVPNTVENQTSMDVGVNQQSAQVNCSGSTFASNPMNIATKTAGGFAGARQRVVGTGEMENVMFGTGTESNRPTGPVLGWSFWSRPNFQNAYSGTVAHTNTDARYLTVDGVDPLMASYGSYPGNGTAPCNAPGGTGTTCPAGTIPTLINGGLTSVTFPHVIDGSYPVWSFLRLVCVGSGTTSCSEASALATSAQNFIALGSSVTAQAPPDFVPVTSSTAAWNSIVVRSHFTPPGTTIKCGAVSNGTTLTSLASHKAPECGGDVGGVVYTVTGDIDYETDFQSGKYVGEINHRR